MGRPEFGVLVHDSFVGLSLKRLVEGVDPFQFRNIMYYLFAYGSPVRRG